LVHRIAKAVARYETRIMSDEICMSDVGISGGYSTVGNHDYRSLGAAIYTLVASKLVERLLHEFQRTLIEI